MVRYIHQEFLVDDADRETNLGAFRLEGPVPEAVRDWKEPLDLFDWPGPSVRFASLSEWEGLVARPRDLEKILSRLSGLDRLILLDDRPKSGNPNAEPFARRHLLALLRHCRQAGVHCEWADADEPTA